MLPRAHDDAPRAIATGDPMTVDDPSSSPRLRQVILREHPVEITVSDPALAQADATAAREIGVTPGDTDAIFDRYWQQDAGSAGAGLGLHISRGLARAHGGDITVQPAKDEGSEFRLSFPAAGPWPGSVHWP